MLLKTGKVGEMLFRVDKTDKMLLKTGKAS